MSSLNSESKIRTTLYGDGSKRKEEYINFDGELHRVDGPALIEYYNDGTIRYEEWFLNGKRYYFSSPAFILNYSQS